MYCDSIQYIDYRNIASAEIRPGRGVNILYGRNAEGKTNALEGIYLFAHGRSFRASKERELIRFGQSAAALKLSFTDRRRSNELEIRIFDSGKRLLRRNGVPVGRLSEFIGSFRAVLFCPQHLSIVREGPSTRRNFLDSAIAQTNPEYIRKLQEFSSVLEQRNALIKGCAERQCDFESTIGIWSERLALASEAVSSERADYTARLNKKVSDILGAMTGGAEKPELAYRKARTAAEYLAQMREGRESELRARTTLYGAHREDMEITLGGREARLYASQGQQRSIAIALKLAEGELSRESTGEYPVFLLDDILSELDKTRQSFILGGLEGKQVFITSCDRSASPGGMHFEVSGGSYALK